MTLPTNGCVPCTGAMTVRKSVSSCKDAAFHIFSNWIRNNDADLAQMTFKLLLSAVVNADYRRRNHLTAHPECRGLDPAERWATQGPCQGREVDCWRTGAPSLRTWRICRTVESADPASHALASPFRRSLWHRRDAGDWASDKVTSRHYIWSTAGICQPLIFIYFFSDIRHTTWWSRRWTESGISQKVYYRNDPAANLREFRRIYD